MYDHSVVVYIRYVTCNEHKLLPLEQILVKNPIHGSGAISF